LRHRRDPLDPNRWWKLYPNRPVRTLTAQNGKDTYTLIHYDSAQARVITVHEAAMPSLRSLLLQNDVG
jgi:hypothetical protein